MACKESPTKYPNIRCTAPRIHCYRSANSGSKCGPLGPDMKMMSMIQDYENEKPAFTSMNAPKNYKANKKMCKTIILFFS